MAIAQEGTLGSHRFLSLCVRVPFLFGSLSALFAKRIYVQVDWWLPFGSFRGLFQGFVAFDLLRIRERRALGTFLKGVFDFFLKCYMAVVWVIIYNFEYFLDSSCVCLW